MKKVNRKRNYRLSKAACPGGNGPVFEFPSEAIVKKMLSKNGAPHTIVGLENSLNGISGINFNFILSNGSRSAQRDEAKTYYDYMIPKDAIKRIRSVTIS